MASLKRLALVAVAVFALPAASVAGELRLSIADGRVTMSAKDVTLREILAEWARVGQTRIVNGEKLAGPPLTLELQNVPEAQALDTLLRSAAGYVMAPRPAGTTGGSVYDRIMILASSRPPTTPTVAAFNQRPVAPPPQTMPMPMGMATDDDQDVIVPGGNPNMINMNGMGGMQNPGMVMQPQLQIQQQGPMTAPRPGMVPAAPAVPVTFPNPYQQGVQPSPNVPTSPYQGQPGTVVPTYPSPPPAPATRPGIPQTGRGGGA